MSTFDYKGRKVEIRLASKHNDAFVGNRLLVSTEKQWDKDLATITKMAKQLIDAEVMDLAHTRARDAGRCHCSNCRPDLHDGKDN